MVSLLGPHYSPYNRYFTSALLFSTFLKFKFIYFNWRLITLQYCIGFAIHQHESATSVHVFPILTPHPHLPPCTIPLGHPSAPAPSIHYHASNLDWRSHMTIYTFQYHSPESFHPLSLPQSPKDFYHLCLFCCLTYRVIVTHLSKLHIYALVYCIAAFLSDL